MTKSFKTEYEEIKESTESYIIGAILFGRKNYLQILEQIDHTFFQAKQYSDLFKLIEDYAKDTGNDDLDISSLMIYAESKGVATKYRSVANNCMEIGGRAMHIQYAIQELSTRKLGRAYAQCSREFNKAINTQGSFIAEQNLIKSINEAKNKYQFKKLEKIDFTNLIDSLQNSNDGIGLGIDKIESVSNRNGTVTVVAARPSDGKTTFLMNSLINLTEDHQDKTFLFYSYEENLKSIFVKLFLILMGKAYPTHSLFRNDYPFRVAYGYCANIHQVTDEPILEIFNKIKTLFIEQKIVVIEGRYDELALDRSIYNWKTENEIGGVYIDYIQKIPYSNKRLNRFEGMQQVSAGVLNTAIKRNVPIVIGAQLNREATKGKIGLGMIRECGDIEQDANTVLGLEMNPQIESDQVHLDIDCLKSREGVRNISVWLNFYGKQLLIRKDELVNIDTAVLTD